MILFITVIVPINDSHKNFRIIFGELGQYSIFSWYFVNKFSFYEYTKTFKNEHYTRAVLTIGFIWNCRILNLKGTLQGKENDLFHIRTLGQAIEVGFQRW